MRKATNPTQSTPHLTVAAVAPGLRPGVLGNFIVTKLRDYVEPTRAGTPKGEAIGLSRKKFHAALLFLTSIEVQKQAKLIRVSYGVLRKWRTEDVLLEEVRRLEKEFLDGPFINAANISMDMLLHHEIQAKAIDDTDLEAVKDKRRLVGFEDAEVYSVNLIVAIKSRLDKEISKAGTSVEMVLTSLAWARPLGRIYRTLQGDPGPLRRAHADYLALILGGVIARSPRGEEFKGEEYRLLAWIIPALIHDALRDD